MLVTILHIIASEGTACSADLARRLGVSQSLTENMLDELTGLGYLKVVMGKYPVPCDRCPVRTACLFHRRGRVWALSQKGERLLRRREGEAM